MKIIINENLYIKWDRNQFTLIKKGVNSATGEESELNIGYYEKLSLALKGAFREAGLRSNKPKTIEDLEAYFKSEIDKFIKNLKVEV